MEMRVLVCVLNVAAAEYPSKAAVGKRGYVPRDTVHHGRGDMAA